MTDYKTVEGIKQHPIFLLLTAKQQKFFLTYIETGGDREAAVIQAGFRTKRNDVVAMRQLRSVYVRKLISIFYGYELEQAAMSKSELTGLIAARLRQPNIKNSDFRHLSDQLIELSYRKRQKVGHPHKKEMEQQTEDGAVAIDELVKKIEQERRNGTAPNTGRQEKADRQES